MYSTKLTNMYRQLKKNLFVLTVALIFSTTLMAQKVAVKTNQFRPPPTSKVDFLLKPNSNCRLGVAVAP